MSISQETQLIERAKSDQSAFAELYRTYLQQTYRFVAYRVSSQAQAEDLTSVIWEKVLKSLPRFNPKSSYSFKAWLFRIARNTVTDHYRKQSHRQTVPIETAYDLFDKTAAPSERASNNEIIQQLKESLKKLPEKQSAVLTMRLFDDLSNKEIARILKTSEKTVASNYSRGISKIHQQFKHL